MRTADLLCVASLLRQYFTDDRIMDLWRVCEDNGINTIISTVDDSNQRIGIIEEPTI